ncbi:la-related protein 4-like [Halichondria panicea]|uniref:la-related protein 4-like n=1 Tax=Halichondria panicea TaxID=6063 RepID=UPI00312B3C7B
MEESTTLTSTKDQADVTTQQAIASMEPQHMDGAIEMDDESPLSSCTESRNSGGFMHNFGDDAIGKDFEESPVLLTPVMMEDQSGYLTHMLMPVGNIQSKGLPSNGVLGNGQVSPPPLQTEELKATLMQQVEYYFSKDNLATDKYLLSQMDGDNFVPVTIVANFNQVKRLTTDIDLILEVVKESHVLHLDEQGEKIRAIPEKRCILILREIPQDTPQKDIMALFSGGNCPDFISCDFAENSCWYVTFASEDDAQKAFAFLREEVRTFLGQPIRARIKGTSVQRSSGMPKKPRVSYPMQPMTRTQLQFFPQGSGAIPWASPPNASNTPNGVPYFDRGSVFVPAASGNSFAPPHYRTQNQIQPFHQQSNGGRNPTDISERGRVHPGGRGPRGDRSFSPPLINGDMYSDRERGPDRVRGRGEHSRDHYRGGGGPERSRYTREDTIQKIPRLSKKNAPRPSPSGGPPKEIGERRGVDERQSRPQQSLDLAPGNFPPLPTSEAGGTSPPSTTPTQTLDSTDTKNTSNLADIVKGRRLKDGAPLLTITNHPPLPSSTNGNAITDSSPASTAIPSIQTFPQAVESTKPIMTNTTLTSAQSITVSPSPLQTQPPSIAAVVAANIPPPPRMVVSIHSAVSTAVNASVTTAAAVVASGAQSTVVTTSTVNSSSIQSSGDNGRPYKGSRGDSKGPYRGDRGYYANGSRQGSGRHSDKDSRQNGTRNSVVSKDGRSFPPNKRNRDRGEKKGGVYRNGAPRPSPKPPKKNQPPQAPPPPPTPTNEPKVTTSTKPTVDKIPDSKSQNNNMSKSEKLSYAQMAQRKKAPPSPVTPPAPKQDTQSDNNEPPTKSLSAPTSPKGERKNNKTIVGQSNVTSKPSPKGEKNAIGEGAQPTPSKLAVSKSAPASPSKEAATLPQRPKDN